MNERSKAISNHLWRIYRRPERPLAWEYRANLPWNDPDFSARMLREHLDESHGAASRVAAERLRQIDWLWEKLELQAGQRLFDVTCGPGLYAVEFAKRGVVVDGVDFGPAAIAYARELAQENGVADRCTFIEQDIHAMTVEEGVFDAAILIYGQLAVMTKEEAQEVLHKIGRSLCPGGKLCLELLHPDKVDKKESNWWYTGESGLWGDAPFLHLGERFWDEAEKTAVERYQIIHLETGDFTDIQLCDRMYTPQEIEEMLKTAVFQHVTPYPAWDGLDFYDADEWIAYVAQKKKA
ncbi:MAG: class I SAM-dependent methyltransferase [Chloroflexota bacterium]